ncbi:MAG: Stp1/IreP family PP2C-type Ser/Thr phosphatase [Burkholderiales bacterium]|jgi:protein phosphatase|nr:Stp1/IreP family PP2C-type Ser/Thr phosphatase [Burkholderiales bacterium]
MLQNQRTLLQVANQTDRGRVREHNEDYVFADAEIGLLVLADGMGGYNAGEIASKIAVETVVHGIRQALDNDEIAYLDGAVDPENGLMYVTTLMRRQIIQANRKVYEASINEPDCEGMGTTIVVALFCGKRFTVAHVGDSRAYRWREGLLQQLTRDHSLLQEQIDHAEWQADRAKEFPHKNLVTRALGADRHVQVDIAEFDVLPNDVFMLCSDGLTDMLDRAAISRILGEYPAAPASEVTAHLIDAANKKGGRDNISVILLYAPTKPTTAKKK